MNADTYREHLAELQLEIQQLRKTGRWEAFYHGGTSFTYRCSACGVGSVLNKTNFCPNCGARMEDKT